MKKFKDEDAALEWMRRTVDDPYIDNERFAYIGDRRAQHVYHTQQRVMLH